MKTIIVIVLIAILNSGCFDIFREDQKIIVGDISVINSGSQKNRGYMMVLYEDEFNKNILNEYIIDVNGNDTLLLVRGIDIVSCSESFYSIAHHKGKGPLKVDTISNDFYTKTISNIKDKYEFSDASLTCP